ncbi:Anhydro-N-acetylmuramic acid kinase [Enhygromyxa salina]|uniref:Anhydro-N-acetylmuramic acid kinase n=1 Tax=Enhygromyxa salina TaxID=215803 RepID=A0A2S9XGW2_9BACT|nr:anhydro-N-acetylmuramic acid kinase [Enhygromyxa salina]PRP91990.1 Anhydro-N-acetylmuramic acid kinase [Enhygromyxa salina]
MTVADPIRTVGIMSGTSGDGVDAVLLELEGVEQRHEPRVLDHAHLPFESELQAELTNPTSLSLARLSELHAELPRRYAAAVRELDGWERCAVVGMHGQTLWHGPPSASESLGHRIPNTLQIGSTAVLAEALARPVVGDLRSADMFHGGEGAPIVPFAHWFFTPVEHAGRLIVNVGGIANITHVTADVDDVVGYDIGPGMMIADYLARALSFGDLDYDRDGQLSRGGKVVESVVDYVFAHAFFHKPPPRSTGREDFGRAYAKRLHERFTAIAGRDLLTSVLAVTARAIVRAAAECEGVREVLLTGGGAKNPTLLRLTRESLALPVERAEHGVFAASCHEPAAIALIAARTLAGLPSSLPRVTGADRACVLGHIARPSAQVPFAPSKG